MPPAEAEAAGYTSFWVNYPGSVDGLAALALAAAETTRIALGVGVIPLHTHGPDRIIADVRAHALPLDRLLLGVGSPNPGSLARVRAGIAALRAALPSRLYVAALGPRMCHLAGEVADGVLFNWLTPEHARTSAEWVRAGAAAARRRHAAPRRLRPRCGRPLERRPARGGGRPVRRDPRLRGPLRADGRAAGGHGGRRGHHPPTCPTRSPGGSPPWTTSWSGPSRPRTPSTRPSPSSGPPRGQTLTSGHFSTRRARSCPESQSLTPKKRHALSRKI